MSRIPRDMGARPLLPIILGSQSPRRRELLQQLAGQAAVTGLPPLREDEPDFAGIETLAEVDAQILRIARLKFDDVWSQWTQDCGENSPDTGQARPRSACLVTADTVIVGFPDEGGLEVCGKPTGSSVDAAATVRRWFRDLYAGRRHLAKTGLCVGTAPASRLERVVTTEVWFRSDAVDRVDWYLQTGEPFGKAGGYAIQESGSLFVSQIVGSLSNIVGLPLAETLEMLEAAGVWGK